jgi:multidrug efflux pump subunit AcrA (membrane-fusion protein)
MNNRIALFCVLILVSLLYGCGDGEETRELRKAVEILKVKKEALVEAQSYIGVLEADREVKVSSLVPGLLKSKIIKIGDYVEAGQLLAIIDQEELLLQKAALEGQVQSLQAQYEKARMGAKQGEIAILEAQVAQTKTGLDLVENEVKRLRELYSEGAISIQSLEQAESQEKVASLKFKEASEALKLAKEGASTEELEIIQGQLIHAEEQLKLMNKKISDTEIKAPKAGYILESYFEEGEMVSMGYPLFVLGDTGQLQVEFDLTDEQISKIQLDQEVKLVRTNTNKKEMFTGKVVEIGQKPDSYTRMYKVKVLLVESSNLFPGIMVEGQFSNGELESGIYIPLQAVISSSPESKEVFIYDQKQEMVFKRKVKLGDLVGDRIKVKTGLKPGDLVLTAGQQVVQEGDLVKVVGRK